MRKRKLNQREIKQLRRWWEDPYAFDQVLGSLLPEDVKRDIEKQVAEQMAQEGKLLDLRPGVGNRWGGEYAQRELERMRAEISRYLQECRDTIQHTICVQFDYCRRKKEKEFQDEQFTLVVAVADALLPIVTGVPLPITAITFYILRYHVLDGWCGCE